MKQEKKKENKLYIPPQTGNVRWKHIIMLSSSVIPRIYTPVLIFVVYTTILKIIYDNFKQYPIIDSIFFPTSLVTYLGLVLSLLMVFRNNSAYDRYWEGRKAWGNIIHHTRNLSRHIWIGVDIDENDKMKDEKINLKKGVMRLIIALATSISHSLRGEYGWDYNDLAELVQHVPRFNSLITAAKDEALKILPLEIAFHIEGYIFYQKGLPAPFIATAMGNLNAIIENFTTCERILTSPIPLIYGVHIKHAMIIYLFTLPLQIIKTCGWASIVIILLTSFTFFGIEAISSEIENPFGGDENDLKLELFCQQINSEINNLMKYFPSSVGLIDWLECEEMDDSSSSTNSSTTMNVVNDNRECVSLAKSSSTVNLINGHRNYSSTSLANRDYSSYSLNVNNRGYSASNLSNTREMSSSNFSRASTIPNFVNTTTSNTFENNLYHKNKQPSNGNGEFKLNDDGGYNNQINGADGSFLLH